MLAPLITAMRQELERGVAAPIRARLTMALQRAARSALWAGLTALALLTGIGFLLAAAQMGLARMIGSPLAATAIGIALLVLAAAAMARMGRKAAAAQPATAPPAAAPPATNPPSTTPPSATQAAQTALPGPVADYIGFMFGFVVIRALLRWHDRKG